VFVTVQDGSTMLMEAAKGGHFEIVSLLLDWPASHTATSASTDAASHTSKVLTACTYQSISQIALCSLSLLSLLNSRRIA